MPLVHLPELLTLGCLLIKDEKIIEVTPFISSFLLSPSALDAESEYLVQEALERLMVGRTVITIAHRLSTIKRANNIAVLEKGSVVELGSYEELMRVEDGVFRKLVERQTVMN